MRPLREARAGAGVCFGEEILPAPAVAARAEQHIHQANKTALITVGGFLGSDYDRSELYNPTFAHGFRAADPSKLDVKPEVK